MSATSTVNTGAITFTRAKLSKLEREYDAAKAAGKEIFVFEGHELLVNYAKYLIQYLNDKFKPDTREVEISD